MQREVVDWKNALFFGDPREEPGLLLVVSFLYLTHWIQKMMLSKPQSGCLC